MTGVRVLDDAGGGCPDILCGCHADKPVYGFPDTVVTHVCSECGHEVTVNFKKWTNLRLVYCGECGAKVPIV